MRIKLIQDRDTILKILTSDDVERKLRLLDRLDGVNTKDSVKILIKMLEEKSWVMREKAALKLAAYGPKVSLRLKRLLRKGYWYTRASACLALGEIADMHMVGPIVTVLLNDENPTVQKEASNAILKLARKKPEKFALELMSISLKANELKTVLGTLEQLGIEQYSRIKEKVMNERNV